MQILIIEDDSLDFHHIKKLLGMALPDEDIVCDHMKNADNATFYDLLAQYDLCILDQNLGERSGLDIIRDLKKSGCLTPIILLTGVDDAETDIAAAKLGASDFLVKGQLTPKMLSRSIRYSVARAEHEASLVATANKDELTNLANKKHLDEYLAAAIDQQGRHHESLTVAAIDIDGLGRINADYGFASANDVLRKFSARLSDSIRKTDFVARYAADVFIVVYATSVETDDVDIIAALMQSNLREPFEVNGASIACTATYGLATKPAFDDDMTSQALLSAALQNLSENKIAQRNGQKTAGSAEMAS